MKKALITGITGQDGSYLAELLLEKGYKVFGLTRRTSTINYERIKHIEDQVELLQGDLLDQGSLASALEEAEPEEVYNLAAQSFVGGSWDQAKFTTEVNSLGVLHLLNSTQSLQRLLFLPLSKQCLRASLFGDLRIQELLRHRLGVPL